MTRKKINLGDIASLREQMLSTEGNKVIQKFSAMLHEKLGSKAKYVEVCQEAEANWEELTPDRLTKILALFSPYIGMQSPAHCGAHTYRDGFGALALLADPLVQHALFKADRDAGVIAAFLHDIGTGIVPRYMDGQLAAGHAQIGAWLVYQILRDVLEENMLLLVCYGTDKHMHHFEDVVDDDGQTTRFASPFSVFYHAGDEDKRKPIGLAVFLPRASDRLENLGWIHLLREILSRADAEENVPGGVIRYTGEKFFAAKGEFLTNMFDTIIRPEWKVQDHKKTPGTATEWVVLLFGAATLRKADYSEHDDEFVVLRHLIDGKLEQLKALKRIFDAEAPRLTSRPYATSLLKQLMRRVNGSAYMNVFGGAWGILLRVWNKLSDNDVAKWQQVLTQMSVDLDDEFAHMLKIAQTSDHPLSALAKEIYSLVN